MKAGWIGFPKETGDFWEAAAKYAQLGYRGMEGGDALLGKGNAKENVSRFNELGLEVLTVSTSVEEVRDNVEAVIERAQLVGAKRATIWAGSVMYHDTPPTQKDFYKEIETMEAAATEFAKENIKLCYHNHSQEFRICYDNVPAIDHMALNSQNLWFEIDVAWTNYAGFNPVAVLKRYASRLGAVHVKDYIAQEIMHGTHKIPVFTSLGTGVVDIVGALVCMKEIEMDWAIYEQDSLRHLNSLESMTQSYLYMKETGLVE